MKAVGSWNSIECIGKCTEKKEFANSGEIVLNDRGVVVDSMVEIYQLNKETLYFKK